MEAFNNNIQNITNSFEMEAYIWEKILKDWSFSFIIKKAALDKQLQITPEILKNFTEKMLQNFANNEETDILIYFIRKFHALNNINIDITLPESYISAISDISSFSISNRSTRTNAITDKIDQSNIDTYYLYWILGGITLVAIAGICYYLYKKRKDKKGPDNGESGFIMEKITKKEIKDSESKSSSNYFKYFIFIKRMSLFLTIFSVLVYIDLINYKI